MSAQHLVTFGHLQRCVNAGQCFGGETASWCPHPESFLPGSEE